MITAPAGVEIRPLFVPLALDDADSGDFIEMSRLRNLVYAEISGHDDHSLTPQALLPIYAADPDELHLLWLVLLDGVAVGRVGVDIPQEAGSRVAYWLVELRRSAWSRGIGSAAVDLVEETARAHGRSVLQTWVEHTSAPGPRLEAPTGFGSIPRDHAARFLLRRGHAMEQVVRGSALDLRGGMPQLRSLLETATEAAAGYRVVQWQYPTPSEFADGYAWMKSRMSTDAPAAGMEIDEEMWDPARLARHERTYLDAEQLVLVTAAQHLDTGELAAFNELMIGSDRSEASHQEDTLVLKEHRGHRLGMLVKCAGLLAWRDIAPRSPRMLTYNAEENRPMLDINEAIGFVPVAYEGAWKKVLDAATVDARS